MVLPLPGWMTPYAFTGHMVRHTGLLLLAGPSIALGISGKGRGSGIVRAFSGRVARYPFFAWLAGVGLMWIWHLPALYNSMSMAGMYGLPLLHGLSLLAGGILFSWPVLMPYEALRLPALKAVLYLSSACVCCSLLGLLITFAPSGTFKGVSPEDQQAGGLIMWVPCCFIYLSASMYLLVKWFSDREGWLRASS
jgi:cytochrome c oxidase assembly factor CtaG